MPHATANASQIERQAPELPPVLQPPKSGIVAWLRTWRQVLIAEVLSAMGRRRWD